MFRGELLARNFHTTGILIVRLSDIFVGTVVLRWFEHDPVEFRECRTRHGWINLIVGLPKIFVGKLVIRWFEYDVVQSRELSHRIRWSSHLACSLTSDLPVTS